MYRGGPARTGNYPAVGGQGPLPVWKYRAGGEITSAPVVAGGTVYVTSKMSTPDSKNAATGSSARAMAHAVDALSGKARWSVRIEAGSESSPAVVAGPVGEDQGRVYFGSHMGLVHALDARTGEQIWTSRAYIRDNEFAVSRGWPGLGVHIVSSPAADRGTVYIGGGDCDVYALDAARGTPRWTYQANQELLPGWPASRPLRPGMDYAPQVHSSPAVVDGTVFICGADRYLYALDAATGQPRWSRLTGSEASPAVSGGTVYVGGSSGVVHALDAVTGAPRWQHQAAGLMFGGHQPPAVAGGIVYLAARRGRHGGAVVALDAATGQRRWVHRCRTAVSTAPAVAGGLVYVSTGKHLVALSTVTGARQWRHRPGWLAGLVSSPSVAGNTLFAGTGEGYLYALKAPAARSVDQLRSALSSRMVVSLIQSAPRRCQASARSW
jgi:serine/threonine-protein kinase